MTVDQILTELKRDCWVFEAWMEQDSETYDFYYVVKLTCGVQARGRYSATNYSFKKALEEVYKEVTDKWGKK